MTDSKFCNLISESVHRLRPYELRSGDGKLTCGPFEQVVEGAAVITIEGEKPNFYRFLLRALSNGPFSKLYAAHPQYGHYLWYDQIPKIYAARWIVLDDEEGLELLDLEGNYAFMNGIGMDCLTPADFREWTPSDSITAEFHYVSEGDKKVLEIDTDMLVVGDSEDPDENLTLVTRCRRDGQRSS